MPKPTPDYLPAEIDEKAKSLGLNTYEYSATLGLNSHRLYSFYSKKHKQFAIYCRIADYAEITLEDLALKAQSEQWEELFKSMLPKLEKETQKKASFAALSSKLELSNSFIADKIASKKGLNGLHLYWSMSRAQGITLDKLRSLCGL